MAPTTLPTAPFYAPSDESGGAPAAPPGPAPRGGAAPGRVRRLVRGRPGDPAWVRPALLGLLGVTALLYLWDLGATGWGNTFYAGAVQAGTKSWKAFFFGSSDASNFITVDKPPASLWAMELSARVFGLNSWSVLAPQALEGVAAVAVVYVAVRRWFSAGAGLLAGAILALTPVAALMFKFNNPDALLVLLLTLAGYATMRAVESGRTAWLATAGALVGFGFLTKELQAFLVVPALAAAYLLAGPPRLGRRIVQLLIAGAALVASAGWWVAAVQLTPAADRPYIGGSQDNSLWNVIFGYNGFGRLTGNETGSVGGARRVGGGGGGSQFGGTTGLTRLFHSDMGTDIAWLIPTALVLVAAGLWWTRRAPRTDRSRAGLLLWGGCLAVTAVTFSFGQGIIHPYYTVALAPLVAVTVGIGASLAWARRTTWAGRSVMAVAVAAAAVTGYELLDRVPQWNPWLRPVIAVLAAIGIAAMMAWPLLRNRAWRAASVGAAVVAGLLGPAAYTLDTATTAHAGAIPTAGPTSAGGPGGAPGGGPGRGFGRAGGPGGFAGVPGGFTGGPPPGGLAGAAGGSAGAPGGFASGPGGAGGGPGGAGGGIGGLLNGPTVSKTLTAALEANSSRYTWVAATIGSEQQAGYQLASRQPVMSIGGFNGSDPSPSLAQFERYVAAGKIHYFITGGFGGPGGTTQSVGSQITTWVEANFTAQTIGGTTVYDLTTPAT